MAISKVVFGNDTLIDITDTTATASDVVHGKYFYDSSGVKIEGTAVGGGMIVVETEDEYGGTIVDISGEPVLLQTKSVTPAAASQTILPDEGYTGLSKVNLAAVPTEEISIASNGSYYPTEGSFFSKVTVSVESTIIKSLDVIPSLSTQIFDAISTPTVAYTSQSFTGSGTKSWPLSLTVGDTYRLRYRSHNEERRIVVDEIETDFVCGDTLTPLDNNIPGNISATQIEFTLSNVMWDRYTFEVFETAVDAYCPVTIAAMPTAAQAVPSISVSGAGVITATATQAAGYVAAGATSSTFNLTTQAAKTVTPTESSQTAVASDRYTTGVVTVAAISSDYVGSNIPTQAAKTVSPTESEQTAVASGVYTVGIIKVGAISSNYVGSNIPARSSSDLTASGSAVTVPSGYYAAAATKNISAGSAATPATTISITPGVSINSSTGVVTATASGSQYVTPTVSAGYVSAGTSGRITVSGSNTLSLTTQAAATITPSTSVQTAVASHRYTTGTVTVAAIPSQYKDITGVTATASDVVSGKTFVNSSGTTTNGSLVIQHYYTGSGAPAAATGSNGDIYLKTS